MRRQIVNNLTAQIGVQALAFAERIVLIGILVRAWGPDVYADWVILFAAAGLLALGELGMGIYFGNSWQKAQSAGDQTKFARLLRVSIFTYGCVVMALAAIVAIFVAAQPSLQLFELSSLNAFDALVIFLLLAGVQLVTILRGSITQIYRGRGEFARGTLANALPLALYILFAGLGASLANITPIGVASIYLITCLIGTAIMVGDLRRRNGDLHFRPSRPSGEEFSDLFTVTKWNFALLAMPIAILNLPVLILGSVGVVGAALASFTLMRTLTNYARTLMTMISLSTGVEIVSTHHRGEKEKLIEILHITGRTMSACAGCLGALIYLYGQDFITLWTGHSELFDARLMLYLTIAVCLSSSAAPIFSLLMLSNQPKRAAFSSLAQLATILALTLLLAPRIGALGAAIALIVGEIVAAWLILPWAAHKSFGINPLYYLIRTNVMLALSAFWSSLIILIANWILPFSTVPNLLVGLVIFGLFAFIPAMLLSLPTAQRLSFIRVLSEKVNAFLHRGHRE